MNRERGWRKKQEKERDKRTRKDRDKKMKENDWLRRRIAEFKNKKKRRDGSRREKLRK